ncbi:interferon-induced protein 44-like isoform X1 [Seriola lalandi dorsalis]|uniref:interferon-induced protein 44-like isoform X1 n=2 Tax=Seriola TaxID=8160 RepID=UPI000C6F7C61|nr:interferon-induced protein 44-like isoform X1 [Seriola lalandi dorsalis]XP_056245986.1 interferon-induced protein 44-like isoform X1 [Seriola aureovittata]
MEGRLVDKLNKLTLDQPWRAIFWGDKQRDLQYVQEYKPENGNVSHLRVLLYGPVGAGKSSFINSVSNVLRGRMTIPTLASATTSNTSFTRRYETFKIRKGKGNPKTFYPFVFNDVMGLEEGSDSGVRAEDIKLAMKGGVREGYKFNPLSPLSERDPGYNPTPSPDDRVHILVCVFSANSAEIKGSVLQKMKAIRETASDLAIPQMAIVTNIDAACAEIEKDLKNVYMSKHLKKKMTDFSSAVGIPMNCICPVKNYSQEIQINDEVDSLIVSALRLIIDFGDDFIDNMQTSPAGQ